MAESQSYEVLTPRGPGQVVLDRPGGRARPAGLLVLGHGASGGVDAPDLVAVTGAALAARFAVARTTQPYRVAGRRVPPAPDVLDESYIALVTDVRRRVGPRVPLIVGGRSSGARVACRTAAPLGALGALALAFPLHPPGAPEKSRAGELDPDVATLVVNGDRDPFGVPEPVGLVRVEIRPGNRHDLRKDLSGTAALVVEWLQQLTRAAT
jgi:predicted alpha/beta-hydrolase family hydrolase